MQFPINTTARIEQLWNELVKQNFEGNWYKPSPEADQAFDLLRQARMNNSDYKDFVKHAPNSRIVPLRYYEVIDLIDRVERLLE